MPKYMIERRVPGAGRPVVSLSTATRSSARESMVRSPNTSPKTASSGIDHGLRDGSHQAHDARSAVADDVVSWLPVVKYSGFVRRYTSGV